MANTTFGARVKNKCDTEAGWTKANPLLLDGEVVVVKMTNGETRFKVGDGTSKYSKLPFSPPPADSLLSDSSTNSPQNKVVYSELNKKFDKTGGTINGNVYTVGDTVLNGSVRVGGYAEVSGDLIINKEIVNCNGYTLSFYHSDASDPVLVRIGVGDPTGSSDATNKSYVDSAISLAKSYSELYCDGAIKNAIGIAINSSY